MASIPSQNLPEAPCPQLWIPHWLPTLVFAAQARHWPTHGPAHRGWETAGKEEVLFRGQDRAPLGPQAWRTHAWNRQYLDTPGLQLGGLLGFPDCREGWGYGGLTAREFLASLMRSRA